MNQLKMIKLVIMRLNTKKWVKYCAISITLRNFFNSVSARHGKSGGLGDPGSQKIIQIMEALNLFKDRIKNFNRKVFQPADKLPNNYTIMERAFFNSIMFIGVLFSQTILRKFEDYWSLTTLSMSVYIFYNNWFTSCSGLTFKK